MRKDGAIDLAMYALGKKKFASLYAKTQEERRKLREHDAYRQALLDLFECACQASGMTESEEESFYLLGKVTFELIMEHRKITENQE